MWEVIVPDSGARVVNSNLGLGLHQRQGVASTVSM